MQRIDDATAATSLPAPEAAGTPGYFTEGNPTAGTPATNVRGSWLNMVQEELMAVVVAGGLTPSKTTYTQVRDAINAYVGSGRLLRTTMYLNVSGTQQVSVDGGTLTTTGATTFNALSATKKLRIRVIGGGGAGGGTVATSASQISIGAGGSAGSYSEGVYTSGFASALAVTVGAGGVGASGAAGGSGGASSVGSLVTAAGGIGANSGGATANSGGSLNPGQPGGSIGSGGNIVNTTGQYGGSGIYIVGVIPQGGSGGSTVFGAGGVHIGYGAGTIGQGYGVGGSGACANVSTAAQAGGAGTGGIVLIEEFA